MTSRINSHYFSPGGVTDITRAKFMANMWCSHVKITSVSEYLEQLWCLYFILCLQTLAKYSFKKHPAKSPLLSWLWGYFRVYIKKIQTWLKAPHDPNSHSWSLCVLTTPLAETSSSKDQISAHHVIIRGSLTHPYISFCLASCFMSGVQCVGGLFSFSFFPSAWKLI